MTSAAVNDGHEHDTNNSREEGTELGAERVWNCSQCGVEMIRRDA